MLLFIREFMQAVSLLQYYFAGSILQARLGSLGTYPRDKTELLNP